jgi:hypothetical protein
MFSNADPAIATKARMHNKDDKDDHRCGSSSSTQDHCHFSAKAHQPTYWHNVPRTTCSVNACIHPLCIIVFIECWNGTRDVNKRLLKSLRHSGTFPLNSALRYQACRPILSLMLDGAVVWSQSYEGQTILMRMQNKSAKFRAWQDD